MHRNILWLVCILIVTGSVPAASAVTANVWWTVGDTCDPATETLRDAGVTEDNNTTTDPKIEYDPLKGTGCADLRDDLARAVYEETGTPTAWGCSRIGTSWETCVGLGLEECDLWISWLAWHCFGGIFPDNHQ